MRVVVIAFACLASIVSCNPASHPRNPAIPITGQLDANEGIFDQLIDHNNPSLGTFQQRYWWNTGFWNGSGSPVIVFNTGEVPVVGAASGADYRGYLYSTTLTGQYAQAVGGASIVIEHRYWGTSSPFTDLTPENLKYLTVAQAVQDMTNFANNVVLPFDTSGNSNAAKAPWVLVGGSYSGALAAWTEITAPGTFWAYHGSSAPVQAIEDYWEYFEPIQLRMPANCSSDLAAVIDHVDTVLTTGADADKLALKTAFGLSTVVHDADFAEQLVRPLDFWQVSISTFLPFCDALEGVVPGQTPVPGPNGVGLTAALQNFASYFVNSNWGCSVPDCYDSYNPSDYWYTNTLYDPTVEAGRQWQWILCNEALGFWQTGAPAGQPTIVSRLVTADYWQQQCNFYFPGVTFGLTEDQHNIDYMGWNIQNSTRLMFSNGEFDPWRSAGVSSEFRPGGPVASTPEMPIFILPDGIHAQDLYMNDVTPEILAVRAQEVAQMSSWIAEYYHQSGGPSSTSSSSTALSTSTTSVSSLVTSVIYSTTVYNVTSCNPSITSCPASLSHLTTGIVTLSTTLSSEPTQLGSSISTSTSIPLVGIQPTYPSAYPNNTSIATPSSNPPVVTQTTSPVAPSRQSPYQSSSSQFSFSAPTNATATLFPTTSSSSTQPPLASFTGAAARGSVAQSMVLFLGILVALCF